MAFQVFSKISKCYPVTCCLNLRKVLLLLSAGKRIIILLSFKAGAFL